MPKPILIFDGDCNFCRVSARYGQKRTGDRVVWTPYQQGQGQRPSAVQFVDEKNRVFFGAEAVFRCLAWGRNFSFLLWLYKNLPGFSRVADFLYRFVARHR